MRAHLEDDFVSRRYRVWLIDEIHGAGEVIRRPVSNDGRLGDPIPANVTLVDGHWATLPYEAAHALLGALARQLGAVEHPEQLRRDYEAERRRVDRLIAHLTPEAKA